MQSSSATTSIVVSMVGAGAMGVRTGIYMIMGANIGTSVASTIVAIGQIAYDDQFERATVHDMFNWMTVAILLPVEVVTGYLYYLTEAITKNITPSDDESRTSFVKTAIGFVRYNGRDHVIHLWYFHHLRRPDVTRCFAARNVIGWIDTVHPQSHKHQWIPSNFAWLRYHNGGPIIVHHDCDNNTNGRDGSDPS
mmetsp:Transcript_30671/g.74305  ORF Transcript_30671/g.74305 Transcript_30671/m.74305 type:complete len:194 (+) Transcript_30671:405-986(+)